MSTLLHQAEINAVDHPLITFYPWLKKTSIPGVRLTLLDKFSPLPPSQTRLTQAQQLDFFETGSIEDKTPHIVEIPHAQALGRYGHVVTPDGYLLRNSSITGMSQYYDQGQFVFRGDNVIPLKGRVATIASEGSCCYFHWMCDILPRLHMLHAGGFSYDHLLVSSLSPFQVETLRQLNVDPARIVRCRDNTVIQAETLVFPSFLSNSATHNDITCRPDIYQWVKSLFPISYNPRHRYYISRDNVYGRQLRNAAELKPVLEEFGFQMIYPEHLSIREQAERFSSAEAILGIHGSGLTNMIFAPSSCRVFELVNPSLSFKIGFQTMGHTLGLEYHRIIADVHPDMTIPSPLYGDLVIQPERLRQFFKEHLGSRRI